MVLRLLLGLLKGLFVGALIGFALAKLGVAAPGALVAYPTAALVGALVGLVAGKPIWAQDGKIEAGLKAGFGALLAAGLMWLVRKFLTMGIPVDLGALTAHASLGGAALTSLPIVGGVLGAFYDADNTPGSPDEKAGKDASAKAAPARARIGKEAGASADLDLDELLDEGEARDKSRSKK